MSTTTLSVYPHLPPTTNLLNSQQRTRLMRSTRKLGAVLGATPCLLDSDAFKIPSLGKSTSRALKRQGSIFTHHQHSSSSITSISTASSNFYSPSPSPIPPLCAEPGVHSPQSPPINPSVPSNTLKRGARDKPPQLYLQLNTIPASPTNDHFASLLPPSPGPCPLTPTTPEPDVAEIRRKRMAKLARHLGEKIPVELVFTPEPTPKSAKASPDRHPRRRSRSVDMLSDDAARVCANKPLHGRSQSQQDWVGEWNRENIRDVQAELRNLRIR